MRFNDHLWIMQNAFDITRNIVMGSEVPIAAIITDKNGKEISRATNLKEKNYDSTAHAEILALKEAAQKNKNWRLTGYNLYVTLEPCIMCLSAMSQFRISKLFFGAYDPKGGAISLGYDIHNDSRLNHKFDIVGGLMQYENSRLLSNYFRERRGQYALLE